MDAKYPDPLTAEERREMIGPVTLPEGLTGETVLEAMYSHESIGFCLACGQEHSCVEPDGRGLVCEVCESASVYGADEILIMVG